MNINWTSIYFKDTSPCDYKQVNVVGVADKTLMDMNPTNRDGFVIMPMSDFKALNAKISRLERLQRRMKKVIENYKAIIDCFEGGF